jgi:hypothetical protein
MMSRAEWKSMLLDQIAITTQRGNAAIMAATTVRRHHAIIRQRVRRDPDCYECVCVG